MKFHLHNLNGHAFSYTPETTETFEVERAAPGTRLEAQPSGALLEVPNDPHVTIHAWSEKPLVLYPGDKVTAPAGCTAFDALLDSGEAVRIDLPFIHVEPNA